MKKGLVMVVALALILGTVFTLFIAAPSPSPVSAAGNLVQNRGFETTTDWTVQGAATRTNTPPIHSGSWVAQITGAGGSLTQVVDVTGLFRYECWGWIYATANVEGRIELTFLNGSTVLSEELLSATDTTGFELQKITVDAPLEATQLQIRLAEGGAWGVGEDVRFDNIGVSVPGGCFIATAAYGTSTADQLDVLRAFRDQVLLESAIGSRLVAMYYQASPPLAEFLSQHSILRTVVRELVVEPTVFIADFTKGIWGD